MLFRQEVLERIAAGEIMLAFRRWRRPSVKGGGRLRTAVGELAIEKVEAISLSDIRLRDAKAAGYDTLAALHAALDDGREGVLYRIAFRLAGPDMRIALRNSAHLSRGEFDEVAATLARLDAASATGAWTMRVLALIEQHPEVRAAELAEASGFAKEWLKTNVRKLKNLGLTESLQPGYRLSPRGKKVLRKLRRQRFRPSDG
jgi:hypothetical protein